MNIMGDPRQRDVYTAVSLDQRRRVALGERLRLARERLDIPLTELALRVGIDEHSLGTYERAVGLPTLPRLRALAEELETDLDSLLEDIEPPPSSTKPATEIQIVQVSPSAREQQRKRRQAGPIWPEASAVSDESPIELVDVEASHPAPPPAFGLHLDLLMRAPSDGNEPVPTAPRAQSDDDGLDREAIERAAAASGYDIHATATTLGIPTSTLHSELRRLGLTRWLGERLLEHLRAKRTPSAPKRPPMPTNGGAVATKQQQPPRKDRSSKREQALKGVTERVREQLSFGFAAQDRDTAEALPKPARVPTKTQEPRAYVAKDELRRRFGDNLVDAIEERMAKIRATKPVPAEIPVKKREPRSNAAKDELRQRFGDVLVDAIEEKLKELRRPAK